MHLIPYPKKLELKEGHLYADAYDLEISGPLSRQLKGVLELFAVDLKDAGVNGVFKMVINTAEISDESYTIEISTGGIRVTGGERGVFYAVQTLRQIVNTEGCFPYCYIEDAPDFAVRGFHYDVTRGRVPTLKGLKQIADICAYLKINMLTLYFEHTFPFREFEGIVSEQERLEKKELIEFVEYCEEQFIDLIPTVAVFGHQYRLLQSDRYRHLCELEDYQPQKHYWQERVSHHTIDISNPESHELVKSFLDQMIEIFPASYISPGVDETFDLCKGRNVGKDVQKTYYSFVKEICEYLSKHDRVPLIYDDILLKYPEADFDFGNAVLLHWDYTREPDKEKIKVLQEKGVLFIAEPSVHSHGDVAANIEAAFKNITNMINLAYKYGAKGIITTAWGDLGHFCDFHCILCAMSVSGNPSCRILRAQMIFVRSREWNLRYPRSSRNVCMICFASYLRSASEVTPKSSASSKMPISFLPFLLCFNQVEAQLGSFFTADQPPSFVFTDHFRLSITPCAQLSKSPSIVS